MRAPRTAGPAARPTRRLLRLAFVALFALAPGLTRGAPAHARSPTAKASKKAPAAKKRPKKRPTRRAAASRAWHTPTPGETAPLDAAGRPMLTLQALNLPDRVTIAASSDGGGFSAEDIDRAARVLRDPRTGDEHPVDPRVLDLVYRVAVHFSVHEVRVVSGYRTPRRARRSNHGKGRAIDLVFPGARDDDVARFAREQGFCGVGVYPNSGFLHLDVRERSYFWVDKSRPGKRSRTRAILGGLASRSDAQALARGERPVPPFAIAADVDATLLTMGARTDAPAEHDDDEHDDDE